MNKVMQMVIIERHGSHHIHIPVNSICYWEDLDKYVKVYVRGRKKPFIFRDEDRDSFYDQIDPVPF